MASARRYYFFRAGFSAASWQSRSCWSDEYVAVRTSWWWWIAHIAFDPGDDLGALPEQATVDLIGSEVLCRGVA